MGRYVEYATASSSQVATDIGRTFAEIRLARNLTQVALAKQAGVSAGTVKRLESGQGATLDSLIRLLQALGLSRHLEAMLPNPEIQPVQLAANAGRRRRRASRGSPNSPAPWSWDENRTP